MLFLGFLPISVTKLSPLATECLKYTFGSTDSTDDSIQAAIRKTIKTPCKELMNLYYQYRNDKGDDYHSPDDVISHIHSLKYYVHVENDANTIIIGDNSLVSFPCSNSIQENECTALSLLKNWNEEISLKISRSSRKILVHWMFDVSHSYGFELENFIKAVYIMDLYICLNIANIELNDIEINDIQPIGIAALSLMYTNINSEDVRDMTDKSCSKEIFIKTQQSIVKMMNNYGKIKTFYDYYIEDLNDSNGIITLGNFEIKRNIVVDSVIFGDEKSYEDCNICCGETHLESPLMWFGRDQREIANEFKKMVMAQNDLITNK